jgi:hypothetical protein
MPPEWLDKIVSGGPALIFALLWWFERDERKSVQEELKAITERVVIAMTETKSTLATFGSLLTPTRHGK